MANNDSTKRVPLELLCMLILKEGDRYGYEMVQEIESRSGGLLSFNLASVYVALRRLEERGCVSSRTEMTDAARARIGTNFHQLPVNRPKNEPEEGYNRYLLDGTDVAPLDRDRLALGVDGQRKDAGPILADLADIAVAGAGQRHAHLGRVDGQIGRALPHRAVSRRRQRALLAYAQRPHQTQAV